MHQQISFHLVQKSKCENVSPHEIIIEVLLYFISDKYAFQPFMAQEIQAGGGQLGSGAQV